MRRAVLWLGALAVIAGIAVAIDRVPDALARIEAFRVGGFALEGARYLTLEEAVGVAAVPSGASVWDDPAAWEERLRAHPLVRDARITRDLPSTLVFRVKETTPVALVPGDVLEPVDATGRPLPIDPARQPVDLPVLRPTVADGAEPRALSPEELRELTRELARIAEIDPGFATRISELAMIATGDVAARLSEPRVTVLFRRPLPAYRLRQGLRALSDASGRAGAGPPRSVDLRYEDQVVVRIAGSGARSPTPTRRADALQE